MFFFLMLFIVELILSCKTWYNDDTICSYALSMYTGLLIAKLFCDDISFHPDFGEAFIKQFHQFVMKNTESNFSRCDTVYFRPVCFSNRLKESLFVFHTLYTLDKIYFSFFIIGNPMNVKNWTMISHVCNKDALIRVVYIFNIIGQNIVNQSGSCGNEWHKWIER